MFGATYDPSDWTKTNHNGFISVMIQYRLGAFGFLSSEDMHKYGKTNAGLLDTRFALEWVQHITKFGGDPSRVTIGGESSGAGAVMLQAMAYGGREGGLFKNVSMAIY
jgi:carboxylesterase type B